MLFSALKKVREKVTDTRSAFASDEEKPFLDHLDDLRTMFMRIIITLMIAMVGCFIFHKQLLEITYQPAKAAGLIEGEPFALPETIEQPEWSKAEKIAESAALVDPAYRNHFLDAVTGEKPELRALVEAYAVFTAASSVDPGEPRKNLSAKPLMAAKASVNLSRSSSPTIPTPTPKAPVPRSSSSRCAPRKAS